MGNFLDAPKTEKEAAGGTSAASRLAWGVSAMQGWRVSMEDSHTHVADVPGLAGHGVFAVFDGHGGSTVSTYSGDHLVSAFCAAEDVKAQAPAPNHEALKVALYNAFFQLDRDMLDGFPNLKNLTDRSGATALACVVSPSHVVIANAGDSRAVVGVAGKVALATEDHKPTLESEKRRIEAAGGTVEFGRVCGNLAVSRSLGDFFYKRNAAVPDKDQQISAEPDMSILERTPADEFVLLGCDGIWDVVTNEKAYEFITNHLKAGFTPQDICSKLLDFCLQLQSKDNMSAVLVVFDGAPKAEPGFVLPDYSKETPPAPPQTAPGEAAAGNTMFRVLMSQLNMSQEFELGTNGEEEDEPRQRHGSDEDEDETSSSDRIEEVESDD